MLNLKILSRTKNFVIGCFTVDNSNCMRKIGRLHELQYKSSKWTFWVITMQNQIGHSQTGLIVSIVPFEIFIYEFLSVFPADSLMNPDLCFQVGENSLKRIVCIWKPCFRVVIKSPKQWHVTLYAQVCAA